MCRREKWMRSAPLRRLRHPLEESPAWGLVGGALAGVAALLVALPVLAAACVLLPSCLLARRLLLLLFFFWSRRPADGEPERVRGNDGRWLGSAWRRSVIHAVLVFEAGSGLDVAQLRRLLMERVVPLYPRLTRLPVPLPLSAGAGHCWLPDRAFDIRRHVFSGPEPLATEKLLQEYVAQLLSEGLAADKPPWEVHVLRGYGRHEDTVAVLRVHQSVADGMALVRVLCHSLADCHSLRVPQRPHFGAVAFAASVVRACLSGPLTLLVWLLLTAEDCNPLTRRRGASCTGRATVAWSAAIALPKVARIKQVTRCTVNCVLLSALAGAARCLLQGCGIRQPRDMKVVLPVDMRGDVSPTRPGGRRLGSKLAPVLLGLPVGVEGAVPRLWATRRLLDALRSSADHAAVYAATAALVAAGPGGLARRLLAAVASKASLQFSSVPGPPSALAVGGRLLKGVYPLLPAQGAPGIAVSVFTYADQVYVAAIADSALEPAASTLLEHLNSQVELLWKLLLHRRVPGETRPHLAGLRPDVAGSPVRELRLRLSTVQREVQSLSQGSQAEAARLRLLKSEFSQLLTELQRRHSHVGSTAFLEDEEVDGELRPRRRAMSCTTSRCSHLSLVGLLSSGRPASYAEPAGARHAGPLARPPGGKGASASRQAPPEDDAPYECPDGRDGPRTRGGGQAPNRSAAGPLAEERPPDDVSEVHYEDECRRDGSGTRCGAAELSRSSSRQTLNHGNRNDVPRTEEHSDGASNSCDDVGEAPRGDEFPDKGDGPRTSINAVGREILHASSRRMLSCNRNSTLPTEEHSNDDTLHFRENVGEVPDENERSVSSCNPRITSDKSRQRKGHFQPSHYPETPIRPLTKISQGEANVPLKFVTKVECYVEETNATDVCDCEIRAKDGFQTTLSPHDNAMLKYSECHPLLPKNHTAHIFSCHSEGAASSDTQHCPPSLPCTDYSHSSCVTGMRTSSHGHPCVKTCTPRVVCDTGRSQNADGTCERTNRTNLPAPKHESATGSFQCVCCIDVCSDSNIQIYNKNLHTSSVLPGNLQEPLANESFDKTWDCQM